MIQLEGLTHLAVAPSVSQSKWSMILPSTACASATVGSSSSARRAACRPSSTNGFVGPSSSGTEICAAQRRTLRRSSRRARSPPPAVPRRACCPRWFAAGAVYRARRKRSYAAALVGCFGGEFEPSVTRRTASARLTSAASPSCTVKMSLHTAGPTTWCPLRRRAAGPTAHAAHLAGGCPPGPPPRQATARHADRVQSCIALDGVNGRHRSCHLTEPDDDGFGKANLQCLVSRLRNQRAKRHGHGSYLVCRLAGAGAAPHQTAAMLTIDAAEQSCQWWRARLGHFGRSGGSHGGRSDATMVDVCQKPITLEPSR